MLQGQLKVNITTFPNQPPPYLPARPFLCLALALLTHSAAIVLMLFCVSKWVSLIFPPSITNTTSSIVMLFKNKEKISNSPALQAQPTIYKSRLSLSPPKPRVGNKNSGIEQVINKCITEQFNSKLALF